jgi:hypothetical protein
MILPSFSIAAISSTISISSTAFISSNYSTFSHVPLNPVITHHRFIEYRFPTTTFHIAASFNLYQSSISIDCAKNSTTRNRFELFETAEKSFFLGKGKLTEVEHISSESSSEDNSPLMAERDQNYQSFSFSPSQHLMKTERTEESSNPFENSSTSKFN